MENDAFGNNLEFSDESGMRSEKFSREGQDSLLVRWVMKIKFVKTKEQANYVLLGVAVIAAIFSIYFFTTGVSSPRVTIPSGPIGAPATPPQTRP